MDYLCSLESCCFEKSQVQHSIPETSCVSCKILPKIYRSIVQHVLKSVSIHIPLMLNLGYLFLLLLLFVQYHGNTWFFTELLGDWCLLQWTFNLKADKRKHWWGRHRQRRLLPACQWSHGKCCRFEVRERNSILYMFWERVPGIRSNQGEIVKSLEGTWDFGVTAGDGYGSAKDTGQDGMVGARP